MEVFNVLKRDPILFGVIKQVGSYNIKLTKNPYESLVEAIITQQLSGSAAKSISTRFKQLYSKKFPRPADVLQTPSTKLRKTGLSKMKVSYIKDLSKKIEAKEINLRRLARLSDEEVIESLVQVRGIGRWTAEMFLIFTLGRMDVLPVEDLGLQKGIQRLYLFETLPTRREMEQVSQIWRPYRTVATWYIWKGLKQFDTIG